MTWSLDTATRTLWQEARGENEQGREAVAYVIANRLRNGRWGKTLAEVCLSPLQFSGWNAHDPNRLAVARLPDTDPVLQELDLIMRGAVENPSLDPTGGALFYFNPSVVPEPDWAKKMVSCGYFGNQLFFKERPQTGS